MVQYSYGINSQENDPEYWDINYFREELEPSGNNLTPYDPADSINGFIYERIGWVGLNLPESGHGDIIITLGIYGENGIYGVPYYY
jgi:hypothetical protein